METIEGLPLTPAELYREFEKIDLEFIRFCHEDNGILRSILEKCDNEHLRGWIDHFIRVNDIEIENAMEDVEYDRRTAQELERLQRGRSGDFISRNEIDAGSAEGFNYQRQEHDSFS